MVYNRENSAPTTEELLYLGFENWQINLVKQLPINLQWEAYDEFIRRLMTDGDTESFQV